jgi:hypothetical protein
LANWYTTREAFKRALSISDPSKNPVIDIAIEAASREFDNETGQWFIPRFKTRRYPWPQNGVSTSWILELDQPLQTITTLAKDGTDATAIVAADYFLEPNNSGPPYHSIEIDLSSSAFYSSKDTHQRAIAVTGTWGLSADTRSAGTLAEDDDGSETALDSSDASLIDVGHTVLIGSEQMFVKEKAFTINVTTVGMGGGLGSSKATQSITVNNSGSILDGEIIEIGAERMLVTSASGTTVNVIRAWDGTSLAAHSNGAVVDVYRTLTVERTVNGTSAATHSSGDAISVYEPPFDVQLAVLGRAAVKYTLMQGGNIGAIGSGAGSRFSSLEEIEKLWDRTVRHYRRHYCGLM